MTEPRTPIDVGVCTTNGVKNIAQLLRAILTQRMKGYFIRRIFVVSSGSTDGTDRIIESISSKDWRVYLLKEDIRRGKAAAINKFLDNSKTTIAMLESGDTLPAEGCYEALLAPFDDASVGMTGARPIPVNGQRGMMSQVVRLLWASHAEIATENPKLGELVAFRRTFDEIPSDTVADEAYIQYLIQANGMKTIFVPNAVVFNRGPENMNDYIEQRRRVFIGHMQLKDKYGYQTVTMIPSAIVSAIGKVLATDFFPTFLCAAVAAGLEVYARISAFVNYRLRHVIPYAWRTISSTGGPISGQLPYPVAAPNTKLRQRRRY